MNEAYTKLMLQQNLSAETDAAFYEKLENARKSRKSAWNVAAAVACILLMIPVTVLAVENIFGITKVTQCQRPTYDNKPGIGFDIQYSNLENYSLKDFPPHLQELEETQWIYHDSWEEAEKHLGIDLVENPLLTEEGTKRMTPFEVSWDKPREHCMGIYRAMDGQFYAGSIHAGYQRDGVDFLVEATVTADHPTVNKEDIANYYHGTSLTYLDKDGLDIHTEQYTTQAGIPVLLVTVSRNQRGVYDVGAGILECNAYFAVNNVSYTLINNGFSFSSADKDTYADAKEKVMTVMLEVLEGFTLE